MELTHFTESSMSDHCMILKFDDYISLPIPIDSGIGQGNPPSMPYYTIFSSRLVDIAKGPKEQVVAFVDDVVFLAIGFTFEETHTTL